MALRFAEGGERRVGDGVVLGDVVEGFAVADESDEFGGHSAGVKSSDGASDGGEDGAKDGDGEGIRRKG